MESFYTETGTSRQAMSQMRKRQEKCYTIDQKIIEIAKDWRGKHPKMGSRVLYHTIQNIGGVQLGIGVNKFEKLMSKNGMIVSPYKSKWVKTSDGLGKERFENLINGLQLNNINQVIVGDITYYDLLNQRSYIFTLKDVYSQRILGLFPTLVMDANAAISCLQNALDVRKGTDLIGCIHHTDNGSQYNSNKYKELLKNAGMVISRAANCLENGSSENLNGLVKNSYLRPWKIDTYNQLIEACREVVFLTNEQRAVEELGFLSPIQFELLISGLKHDERPFKLLYNFNQ